MFDLLADMPRGPRVDFPGAVHHVYARGIERRDIFLDDPDRDVFLGRAGINLSKWGIRCSAWALMPNHFHLLLQSDQGCLPSFMQCLLTGYSKYFNDRHKRVGHLFQNRYKSPIVGKSGYFREVVRYIHLNPLRSGIVPSIDKLEEYSWTGHMRIVRGGTPEWQDTSLMEAEFQDVDPVSGWVRNYRTFLGMMAGHFDISELEIKERPGEITEVRSPAPPGIHKRFVDLLHRFSAMHGIPAEQVLAGDRNYVAVHIRREVLRMCKSQMGISIAQLARWLGIKESTARYLLNSGQ